MDEQGTQGVADGGVYQSLDQGKGDAKTSSIQHPDTAPTGDHFGMRYWPGLLQYLEGNFVFSASLLGIVGYVMIAAFGGMKTLGQYLAYAIFLFGIFFVHDLKKGEKKWVYLFISIIFVLFVAIVIQNWKQVISVYRFFNSVFSIAFGK